MFIRGLPLITGLMPIIGINLAYWVGGDAGTLPSCIPYLDGCTSVSATGRYPPGDRLFRAIMLPQAALLGLTWYFAVLWLRSLSPDTRLAKAVLVSGLVGALALILYVTFLGTKEPFYEFMRRFGIYIYFLGTALAQLLLTLALDQSRGRRALLWLVAVPWGLGVINLVQKSLLSDSGNIENSIEWVASILMQLWFVALYFAWRRTGFSATVTTDR